MYLVERVYHTPHVWRVPCGSAEEKTPELLAWRDRLRHVHKDVRRGRCNVSIRRIGGE